MKMEQSKKEYYNKKKIANVSYFELYKFSTRSDKFLLAIAVLLSLVCGITEALMPFAYGTCIRLIINFGNSSLDRLNDTEKSRNDEVLENTANQFLIMLCSIAMIDFILTYASTTLFNYTAMKQVLKIRELYFFRILNQDISWHDQYSSGDFASCMSDDLQKIQEGVNDKVALAIILVGIIVGSIAQSLIVGWKLSLACLVSLPISVLMMICSGKICSKLSRDEAEAYGEAGRIADETLTHIKTVVAFNGQREEMKRYDKLILLAMKINIKRYLFIGLNTGVVTFFDYFGIAIGLWYGIRLLIQGGASDEEYSIERIVIVYSSIMSANHCMSLIPPLLAQFTTAKGAATKIFRVIESQSDINKSYQTGTKINHLKGNISFKDVRFSYPARPEIEILENFNLEVKSGETVALVGSSGGGKSTIIHLIQRFYDASHGQIFLDGNEITTLNLKNVRDHIGMVGQEPVPFDGTIAENIKLGKLGATQTEVEEAAKKSNAHSFITSFPNGYQTVIGEGGTQLSGGQKQRIAIARALIRKPAILLLDEATSALDSKSESVVQAALGKISPGCTTIIVAHRLSTIRQANRIVVLKNGRIVEDGSHDKLMSAKGAYYNLVVTQSSGVGENWPSESNHGSKEPTEEIHENIITATEDPVKITADYKLAIVWKILKRNLSQKWCLIAGILCSPGHMLCAIGCGLFLGKSLAMMTGADAEFDINQINLYSCCIFGFSLIRGAFLFFQSYFIGITGEHLAANLRRSMFKAMVNQDMEWFDRSENGVGSLGARLAGEPSSVQNAISVCSGPLINFVTAVVSFFIVGLCLCWKLQVCFLCFIPVLIVIMYLEQKILVAANQKNNEVLEQSTKLAMEAISNIRTVASLAIENKFHDVYMLKLKLYQNLMIRNIHIQGVACGLSISTVLFSYMITMYYGAQLIGNGETDTTTVIAMTEIFSVFIWFITTAVVYFPNITKGFLACNQMNELLNKIQESRVSFKAQIEATQVPEDIQYKALSFSYPTRPDSKILDGFDLSASKGKTVALVGPSGCGKSTIIHLLERFYDSNSGQITFANNDIHEIHLDTLRLRLGIVMQEPKLFSRTIAENIAYGNIDTKVSKAEIIAAAQAANIHNFIISLPLGYETMLGERGTQLSGGQKQRVAIARALVRNPQVLLLDEATSALDAESEKIIQETLKNAREITTCIVISHRLKAIVDADLIVVVNKGKVVEEGSHQELMNLQGLYWNLYNVQQQQ